MNKRLVIVVCGSGKFSIDLNDLEKAKEVLIVATGKSNEDVKSILDNVRMMYDNDVIKDNRTVQLIEKIHRLEEPYFTPERKPHQNKHYQRHCRKNKWK